MGSGSQTAKDVLLQGREISVHPFSTVARYLESASSDEEFDSDDEATFVCKLRMFDIGRRIVAQLRLRPVTNGISVKHLANRHRRQFEKKWFPLDEEEEKFMEHVLGAHSLLYKTTASVKRIGEALKLEDGIRSSSKAALDIRVDGFSKACDGLHKAKWYAARYCWAEHIFPLKQQLRRIELHYTNLKKQFQKVRTQYLNEISVTRDSTRQRYDPESCLQDCRDEAGSRDIRTFFDPVSALSEEELSFVTAVVSEKLKMIFEKNPDSQTVNVSQFTAMLDQDEDNKVSRLQKQVGAQQDEIRELRKKIRELSEAKAEVTAASHSAGKSSAEKMVAILEDQVDELRQQGRSYESELRLQAEKAREDLEAGLAQVKLAEAGKTLLQDRLASVESEKKELESQVSRLQDVLEAASEKPKRVKSRYLGKTDHSEDDGEQEKRDLLRAVSLSERTNKRLMSENSKIRADKDEVVSQLGSIHAMEAKLAADEALAEARHLKRMTRSLDSEDEGESSDEERPLVKSVTFNGKAATKEVLSEELKRLVAESEQTALALEDTLSDEVPKSPEECMNRASKIQVLRRKSQTLELQIFGSKIMLEALKLGINADAGILKTAKLHCKKLCETAQELWSANVDLMNELMSLKLETSSTVKTLQKSGASKISVEVKDCLSKLAQMSNMKDHHLRKPLPPGLEESVHRLTKTEPSEKAAAKLSKVLEESRRASLAGLMVKMAEPEAASRASSHIGMIAGSASAPEPGTARCRSRSKEISEKEANSKKKEGRKSSLLVPQLADAGFRRLPSLGEDSDIARERMGMASTARSLACSPIPRSSPVPCRSVFSSPEPDSEDAVPSLASKTGTVPSRQTSPEIDDPWPAPPAVPRSGGAAPPRKWSSVTQPSVAQRAATDELPSLSSLDPPRITSPKQRGDGGMLQTARPMPGFTGVPSVVVTRRGTDVSSAACKWQAVKSNQKMGLDGLATDNLRVGG